MRQYDFEALFPGLMHHLSFILVSVRKPKGSKERQVASALEAGTMK